MQDFDDIDDFLSKRQKPTDDVDQFLSQRAARPKPVKPTQPKTVQLPRPSQPYKPQGPFGVNPLESMVDTMLAPKPKALAKPSPLKDGMTVKVERPRTGPVTQGTTVRLDEPAGINPQIINPKYRTQAEQQAVTAYETEQAKQGFQQNLAQRQKDIATERAAIPGSIGGKIGSALAGEQGSQKIGQFINRFARGAGSATGQILTGIGAQSNPIAYEAAMKDVKPFNDWMQRTFPTDQGKTDFLNAVLPEGAGSVIPFLTGTALTRGGPMAAAMLGAAMNAGQTYEEAINSGSTPEEAVNAARIGAVIGTAESLGLGRTLDKFGVKKAFVERAANILEEAGQEGLSQWLGNVNAKLLSGYDPDRALGEGVAEAAAVGGLISGGMQAASIPFERRAQRQADIQSVAAEQPAPLNLTASRPGGTPTTVIPLNPNAQQATQLENAKTAIDQSAARDAAEAKADEILSLPDDEAKRQALKDAEKDPLLNEVLYQRVNQEIADIQADPSLTPVQKAQEVANARQILAAEGIDLLPNVPTQGTPIQDRLAARPGGSVEAAPVERPLTPEQQTAEVLNRQLGDEQIQVEQAKAQLARQREAQRQQSIAQAEMLNRQLAKETDAERMTRENEQAFEQGFAESLDYEKQARDLTAMADWNNALVALAEQKATLTALWSNLPREMKTPARKRQIDGELERIRQNRTELLRAQRNPRARQDAQFVPQFLMGEQQQKAADPVETGEAFPDLLKTVRRLGGVKTNGTYGGEIGGILSNKESGTSGIVNNKSGMDLDYMREALVGEGAIPPETTNSELLEMLDMAVRNKDRERPTGTIDEQLVAHIEGQARAEANPFEEFMRGESQIAGEIPTTQEGESQIPANISPNWTARNAAATQASEDRRPPMGLGPERPDAAHMVSFSQYNDLVTNNKELVNQLFSMPLDEGANDRLEEGLAKIQEFADRRGIEQRHVDALEAYIRSHHLARAAAESSSEEDFIGWIDRQVEEGTAALVEEYGADAVADAEIAIEREVAALDAFYSDENTIDLFNKAKAGNDAALRRLTEYAEQEYGISGQTIADTVRAYRLAAEASKSGPVRVVKTPAQIAVDETAFEDVEAEISELLRQPLDGLTPADIDPYLETLEAWRNRSITRDDVPAHLLRALRTRMADVNELRHIMVKAKQVLPKFRNRTLNKEQAAAKAERNRQKAEEARERQREVRQREAERGEERRFIPQQREALKALEGRTEPYPTLQFMSNFGLRRLALEDLIDLGLVREVEGGVVAAEKAKPAPKAEAAEKAATKEPWQMTRKEFLDAEQYSQDFRSQYVKDGVVLKSSREHPSEMAYPPLGTWRITQNSKWNRYGDTIEQLREIPVSEIRGAEDPRAEGRWGDVERYAGWNREGKVAPPIEAAELANGKYQIHDGHRRLEAARASGAKTIRAWVSPFMDTGLREPNGKVIETDLTHQGVIKQALSEGKPVPAEVLADYPDLKPKKPAPDTLIKPQPKTEDEPFPQSTKPFDMPLPEPELPRRNKKGESLKMRTPQPPNYRPVNFEEDDSPVVEDYRGEHAAPGPDSGAPLHDLTKDVYPDDFYGPNGLRYYGTGEDVADRESMSVIQGARNKPNKKIRIYRAVPYEKTNAEKIAELEKQKAAYLRRRIVPPDSGFSSGSRWYEWASNEIERLSQASDTSREIKEINSGDWVTLSRTYAKNHGNGVLNGNYKIISKVVKASELFTNGDSINEFGYWPQGGSQKAAAAPKEVTPRTRADVENSPEFKRWSRGAEVVKDTKTYDFNTGDSVVVQVFHGTRGNIEEFSFDRLGSNTRAKSAEEGFFFSDSPDVAASYPDGQHEVNSLESSPLFGGVRNAEANLERFNEGARAFTEYDEDNGGYLAKIEEYDQWGSEYDYDDGYVYDTEEEAQEAADAMLEKERSKYERWLEEAQQKADRIRLESSAGANVMPAYVRMNNAFVYDYDGAAYRDISFYELLQEAKEEGHDGAIFLNVDDSAIGTEYSNIFIAFSPTQIKSATGNRGTFDPNDPSILKFREGKRIDRTVTTPSGRKRSAKTPEFLTKGEIPPDAQGENYNKVYENIGGEFAQNRRKGVPGTLYLNDHATWVLDEVELSMLSDRPEYANIKPHAYGGATVLLDDAQRMADILRDRADRLWADNPDIQKNINGLADLIEEAITDARANGEQNSIEIVNASKDYSEILPEEYKSYLDSQKKSRRHESAHIWQTKIDPNRPGLLTNSETADDVYYEKIRDALYDYYPNITHDQVYSEAFAFISSGDWARAGLTKQEAAKWLNYYFTKIAKKYGRAALAAGPKRLHPMTKGILEQARGSREAREKSRNFKRWTNNNPVVDPVTTDFRTSEGFVVKVYHGTPKNAVEIFDKAKVTTAMKDAVEDPAKGLFFFAAHKSVADSYARKEGGRGTTQIVYVRMNNPYVVDARGSEWLNINYEAIETATEMAYPQMLEARKIHDRVNPDGDLQFDEYPESAQRRIEKLTQEITDAISQGLPIKKVPANNYDGIVIKNVLDSSAGDAIFQPTNVFIAFYPTQIKSATGNNGEYSLDNPSILKTKGITDVSERTRRDQGANGRSAATAPRESLKIRRPERSMGQRQDSAGTGNRDTGSAGRDRGGERVKPKTAAEIFQSVADRKAKLQTPEQKSEAAARRTVFAAAKLDKEGKLTPERRAEAIKYADELLAAGKVNDEARIKAAATELKNATREAKELPEQTKLDKLSAAWKAGLLTGPATHIVNILSNTGFQVTEEASRIPASMFDLLASVGTGRRTIAGPNLKVLGAASAKAATEGMKHAKEIWKKGVPADVMENLNYPEVEFKFRSAKVNSILNNYVNRVFRLLSAEDQVFKTFALARSIEAQAKLIAEAEVRRGEIPKSQLADRRKYLYENPTAEMSLQAVEDSLVATFQNDNSVSNFIKSGRRQLSSGGRFTLDMFLPFDRTPTNIIARTLEMTPLGYVVGAKQIASALSKEGFTEAKQRRFAQTFGRASVGTMLMALGWKLGAMGLMSGFYDDDRNKEKLNQAVGRQPNALNLGGRSFFLGGMGPLGVILGLGATLQREANQKIKNEDDRPFKMLRASSEVVLNLPMMQASKRAKEMIDNPGGLSVKAGQMAGSFVPTIFSGIADLFDPFERDAKSFGGAIGGRIPGVRNLLPEKKDALGETMPNNRWSLGDFTRSRSIKDIPIANEMTRLDVGLNKMDDPKEFVRAGNAMVQSPIYKSAGEETQRRMIDALQRRLADGTGNTDPADIKKGLLDADERAARKALAPQAIKTWTETYGEALKASPRFQNLTEEQQNAALQILKDRAEVEAKRKQPRLKRFAPASILKEVYKGASY